MSSSRNPPSVLIAQHERLRDEVREHKSAIRRHREQLGQKKAALLALEAECRRFGIKVIAEPASPSPVAGEGVIHGRAASDS